MNTPMFLLNLGLVVVSLLATIVSGLRAHRRTHLKLVMATVVLLGLAIVQAEIYGRSWSFSAGSLKVHLFFAFSALVCLPFVVASGVCRLKGGSIKKHRWSVVCFVGLVLASVATAAWMFVDAVPFE